MAVQGFGNVGSYTALPLAEDGCKVVAIADVTGAYVNPKGLRSEFIARHRRGTGAQGDREADRGCEESDAKEILELDVDILVPAALESQITVDNASRVKAKMIAEGANGPLTPEADDILREDGGLRDPRHPVQCGRGHGELSRVGPEPDGVLLAGVGSTRTSRAS